jgi:hypothetical protein
MAYSPYYCLNWRGSAQCSPAALVKYLDSIASASSFLVAGALAFFFAKGADASTSSQQQLATDRHGNAEAALLTLALIEHHAVRVIVFANVPSFVASFCEEQRIDLYG